MMMRLLLISLAVFCFVEQLSAQISLPPVVVQSVHGNRVFLEINPGNLQVTLDSITSSLSSENFKWSNVLTNGASPGMDVNFFGYDALGLGQVTTTGTFTGDSLVLVKDATIAGRLSVTGVSALSDSLTVAGFVSLGDSLEVVRAVSIGETLYVTGVTSLGDSLHVAGNVNMAQLLNVVGAATFESTVDVSGETTLNDTLHVNAVALLKDSLHVVGGADFDASVNMDGNASVGGTLGVTDATSLSSTLAVTGVTSLNDSLHVADNADIDGTFNADGATVLGSTLTVSGITTLNDSLHVTGATGVDGNFDVATNKFTVNATSGNTAVAGTLDVTGTASAASGSTIGNLTLADGSITDSSGSLSFGDENVSTTGTLGAGNTSVTGTLSATGATTLSSTLGVAGATTLSSTLGVDGVTTLDSTTVNESFSFDGTTMSAVASESITLSVGEGAGIGLYSDDTPDAASYINTYGDETMYIDGWWDLILMVDGEVGIEMSYDDDEMYLYANDIYFREGDVDMGNDLSVTGNTSVGGTMSITGNTTVGGTLGVTGATTLSSTLYVDSVVVTDVINGRVSSLANHDTDDLAEGSTNLYMTPAERASLVTLMHAIDSLSCTWMKYQGHVYELVLIGDQCWFAENLRTTQYADGSAIPEVTDGTAWATTSDGARAAYNNDNSNLATYGYLYNWYAVDDVRGLCPSGWHVPTDGEYTELTDYLGGTSVAGVQMKSSSSDTPSWDGTNSSGFSALPGGARNHNGNFNNVGSNAYFWSSSPNGSYAWSRKLYSGGVYVDRIYLYQRFGVSVRCVRD